MKHTVKFTSLLLALLLLLSACTPLGAVARDWLRRGYQGDGCQGEGCQGEGVSVVSHPVILSEAKDLNQAPARTLPTDGPPPDNWTFRDIPFAMPDTPRLLRRAETLLRQVSGGKRLETHLQTFDELCRQYESAHATCAYAYIRYCQDMEQEVWQERYLRLSTDLNALNCRLVSVAVTLIEAERDGLLTLPWSDKRKQALLRESALTSPTVMGDMERELALINAYDRLVANLTISYGGRSWTYADIMAETGLGYIDYAALKQLYDREYAAQAGALFVQLAALRGDIASKLGYESYSAYRYDCYRRDYSPEDITALCSAVKTHLVPLYSEATTRFARDLDSLYGAVFPESTTLARMSTAIHQTAPALLEAWDYMQRHELYDLTLRPEKLGGSYTIYISDWHAPFLYSHWDDSATVVSTLIHEFGHFAGSYFNPTTGVGEGECLDLCEVDSQGFEMLAMGAYETLFARHAQAAQTGELLDALYSVIAGCMEDEFARAVYAGQGLTVSEMNRIYLDLAEQYGLVSLYGLPATGWTRIPHHFQSPLYYISYATSMLAALQIWELAGRDRPQATAAYLNILNRKPYAEFQAILAENGLGSPIGPETVETLAGVLREYFEKLKMEN